MNKGSSGSRTGTRGAVERTLGLSVATDAKASGTVERSEVVRSGSEASAVVDFALYLCRAPAPKDALIAAVELLSEILADGRVSVIGLRESDPRLDRHHPRFSSISTSGSSGSSGCSAWVLTNHPDQPTLLIPMDDTMSARDTAKRLTLGEQVVTLLENSFRKNLPPGSAVRHDDASARLMERALQAEKLAHFGQSVACIIHELNSPLTAILAYTDYLRGSLATQNVAPKDLERLERIGEAAERVTLHTRSLVEYARPSGTELAPVDLGRLIQNALVFCEHELSRAKVRTQVSLDPLTVPVVGIQGQLTQLLVNLFTNAAHAAKPTDAELRVDCRLDSSARYAIVEVADNGIGIPAADMNRIFDPFFTTKPEGRGIGLGLSIVREIIQAHDGQIRVDSQVDQGTTFTLRLPLATP